MNYPLVVLVTPQRPEDEYDVDVCEDEAQYKRRWDEYLALKEIFEIFKFEKRPHSNISIELPIEALGYRGSLFGDIYQISTVNLELLQGKAAELVSLREQALAKLTPEEQRALGLLVQE